MIGGYADGERVLVRADWGSEAECEVIGSHDADAVIICVRRLEPDAYLKQELSVHHCAVRRLDVVTRLGRLA